MGKINTTGATWDSLYLAIVKAVGLISSVIQTKLLAVNLSLEEFGTYSQANIIASVGISLTMLGLPDAINYFYNAEARQHRQKSKIKKINTIFFLEIIAGCLCAILIVSGRNGITVYFSNTALKRLIPIIAVKPVMENVAYLYQLLFVSIGRAKLIAGRNLFISVIRIVLIYLAIYVVNDLLWLFIFFAILDVVQIAFLKAVFAQEDFLIRPTLFSKEEIKPILAYSIPMGMYAVANALSREMDKLVIGRLVDTETLAIYASCGKMLPIDIVATSFAVVLIPYIARYISGDKKYAIKLFSSYLKIGIYSVWTLGVAVLITSEQVISLLYTSEHIRGKSIFIIYVLDSMIKFAGMHLVLTTGGKSKLVMRYSILTLLLNLVLNIVFYYAFGFSGPAFATLISSAVYIYLILNKSIQTMDSTWLEVFDVGDLVSFGGTIVATGMFFGFWNQFLLDNSVNYYLSMIVSAGTFCVANIILNMKRISRELRIINKLRL